MIFLRLLDPSAKRANETVKSKKVSDSVRVGEQTLRSVDITCFSLLSLAFLLRTYDLASHAARNAFPPVSYYSTGGLTVLSL